MEQQLAPRASAPDAPPPSRDASVGLSSSPANAEAFGMTAGELSAATGGVVKPAAFTDLQRPWRWIDGMPSLGTKARSILMPLGLATPHFRVYPSRDGSTKFIFTFGGEQVEAVHMPRSGRVTLCLSSQAGCAIGCRFCATASMGLRRHLTAAEIVSQVLCMVHACGPRNPGDISLVFMGMGEPLHNFDSVSQALKVLCSPAGLNLSPRRITVSTSGLVPQIQQLGTLTHRPLLAISLNATTDPLREALMPIARRYNLADLRRALMEFPQRPQERICVEYVLLADVNDSDADAQRLAEFGDEFSHHINLIPFNEHPDSPYREPAEERVLRFYDLIKRHRPGRLVFVRRSRARDVQGACGQLVALNTKKNVAQTRQVPLPPAARVDSEQLCPTDGHPPAEARRASAVSRRVEGMPAKKSHLG